MSLYVGTETQEVLWKRIKCQLWVSVVALFRTKEEKSGI